MSDSIKLSPKYGVNPTIPVCFWCGEEKNEVALMGHIGDGRKHEDFEMPMHAVINYEPCEECQKAMAMGVTIMEATHEPNRVTDVEFQNGTYPTGRWVVMKPEAARRIFKVSADVKKIFVDVELFSNIINQTGVA